MRTPDRGSLTSHLITTLNLEDFPVGDGGAPEPDVLTAGGLHAGWNGDPNSPGSIFVPYLVLVAQTATISSGPFPGPQNDWRLPYSLSSFGVNRAQAEALAHRGRDQLESLTKTSVTLDGVSYKILQIWFDAIGGVGRVDQTSPSTYGEVDTFTVWLSK